MNGMTPDQKRQATVDFFQVVVALILVACFGGALIGACARVAMWVAGQ